MAQTPTPTPSAAAPRTARMDGAAVVLDRAALRVLDAGTLRALQIVPYHVTDRSMRVAAATVTPDLLARQLRVRTGLIIEITPAAPDEIAAALAAGLDPESAPPLLARQTDAWLSAIGVTSASEADRMEALSLATGRPVLDLSRWRHQPALAPLIPAEFARSHQAAPLALVGRTLLVVTSRAVWHEVAERVAADTGLPVQVALAGPSSVARLVAELYDGRALRLAGQPAHAPDKPPSRKRGGHQPRDTKLDAKLVSLRGFTPPPEAAALLPRPLAERLYCLVARVDTRGIRVVVAPQHEPWLPDLLAELLGRELRLITAPEDEIRAAQRRAYRSVAAQGGAGIGLAPLGMYLRRSGQVSPAQITEALAEQSATGERLGRILVRRGVLTDEALLETLALRHDLPHFRLDGALPDPESVRVLPQAVARELGVLALRRQDPVVHVAAAVPPDPGTRSIMQELTGLRVRTVLCAEPELPAAIDLLYHAGGRAPTPELERFLSWLVEQGHVTRAGIAQLRASVSDGDHGVDEALVSAGIADADGVAGLLADFAGLPRRSLWPADRLVPETEDDPAAGLRRLMIDPVDPDAARLLPPGLMDNAVAIPFAFDGDRAVVAVADPFDTESAKLLEDALGGRYERVIATREEIRSAIRRTLGRRNLGDQLLAAGLINAEEMARGLALARRTNVRFGKAMLALGYINQDQLTRALAEQFEMPRVDLSPESVNPDIARLIPAELAQDRGVLPLVVGEQSALVATTDPLDTTTIDELTRRLGRTIRTVLTTEQQMASALGALYRADNVERAALGLLARAPEDSAARVWTRGQVIAIGVLGAAFLIGMLLAPVLALSILVTGVTGFYASFSFYKLYLIYRALGGAFEEEVTPEELAALDDRDLPVYTVLVPMYREASVLPILLQALGRMDYPSTKLDVILLLEEDDEETQAAVRSTRLPEGFRALVVPFRRPKTKPKACNYGLLHARGEFLVIYDAEDVPEPDQLKKAVAVFRRYDERLACIQSKLNYFNRDQNLLTRWFTAEYSQWFDLMLPGLQNSGAPIPLGGTSNHFRTAILREMDGWDPFNTTEDADLGLRIFKRGYRTVVLNSTTYEEANSRPRNWVRQRSRWVKGYMQTWLVHMRNLVRLVRQIGLLPFISFQLVIAGTFFSFLLNPVLWGLTALWFLTHWKLIHDIFPAPVFYVGTVSLYAGNLAFMYVNVLGTLRRRYYPLVTYALFTPVYWAMMSIAAWQAFYELLFKPHYWQKTQHGLFKGRIRMPKVSKQAA